MSDATSHLTTGFLLNERYLVERELGRGGVGVVYLARDEQLHSRPVVIKVLLEESYRDDWIKTKFRQEMEALSRLDHPGIVNLLNTGELPDGRPFLVMQYVEGVLLRSLLRPEGMELERAAALILQIGEALTAAHDRGVLHRDLKPENIMIQSPGRGEQIKVIDFGLAKVFHSRVAESTAIPNVAGSFSYMSPEQLMARPVSVASDVYSFGVIAYEMLTGRRPYNPDSLFQLLDMLRSGVRVKPRDLRPSLPPGVDPVVLKALSYDSAVRQSSAAAFGEQLQSALLSAETAAAPSIETVPVPAATSVPRVLPRAATWFAFAFVTCSCLLLVKASFFRFQSWTYFLTRPQVLIPVLLWLVAFLVAPMHRIFGERPARLGIPLAVSVLLFAFSYDNDRVISADLVEGKPADQPCCVLKYSDPRGYRYTFQEGSYYRIRIQPDRFNRITDFDLRITLPAELEFADIYPDRRFLLRESLSLEPSSSNDILRLHGDADAFAGARDILFTVKYRTAPGHIQIPIELQTSGDSQTHTYAF